MSALNLPAVVLHRRPPPVAVVALPEVGTRPALPSGPPVLAPPDAGRNVVALARPPALLPAAPDLGARPAEARALNVCVAGSAPAPQRIAPPRDPESFGRALAAAARTQTQDFVVYDDKYRRIAYPMGDVPSFYGVCTDVIIRAYRALDIDLQALVQTTRMGSGDPNIDHRRVETLRRFFAAHGQSLPVTDFAEDYRPGDVVSYWRPQNRHSRTHIAIVADAIGPSGRPMIIHNRGWGPQIEDGLFVDQITGHYRFSGLKAGGARPPAGLARPPALLQPARSQPAARREAGVALRKATP